MKSVDEIYQEMLDAFAARTGMVPAGGGEVAVRLYAAAAQIYSLYVQSDWVARQCFPQTAEGEYLDRHAALRGLSRRQAVQAQGTLCFANDEANSTDLTIPAGTVCMTAGLVRFETLENATLAAGTLSVEVPAQAVEAGEAGNAAKETVVSMAVAPVGVKRVSNAAAFSGGRSEEDDDSLRERVLESFRRLPNGANAAFYEQGALSFPQVAAVSVLPKKRGVGTVDVVIADADGVPNEALLAQVQSYFEQRREIAVDVKVLAPEVKTVNVTVQVEAAEGQNAAAVRERVRQAISAWFDGSRLGQNVLRAQLGHLVFETAGVANYVLSAPTADVTVERAQLPQLGTLTVEELI